MRIVGGSHRGRIIEPPRNLRARPTTDFAKENLFNVLGNVVDFEGLRVLDLFAGTGSIGYEFCSRGAGEVTAVDVNGVHCEFIRRTAAGFGFEQLHVVRANVFLYLKSVGRRFDLVFSDAPYDLRGAEEVVKLVMGGEVLDEGGILVYEHGKTGIFDGHPQFFQERKWGNVVFSIFMK